MSLIQLAEKRWLPDPLIRHGMRRLLRDRLVQEEQLAGGNYDEALDRFAERQRQSVVTIETHRANEQHYEVSAEFFELVLGSRLKYSCGWWDDSTTSLDESEDAMLRLACERAGIENGMRVLDLGCGWGSLSLWIAEKFPDCQIISLSNSANQKACIELKRDERRLENVTVITADVGTFKTDERFDRVVSVEMFEHVRNHENLLARIAKWLVPDGKLFVHIFCHRNLAYTFEIEGKQNWMGRHFFSGGIMPAGDLFLRYQRDMTVRNHWWINGSHYSRTCEEWLSRLDACELAVRHALTKAGNNESPKVLVQRWRMFFMACAELFNFEGGEAWGIIFSMSTKWHKFTMNTPQILMVNAALVASAMIALWLISLRLKDASIVDIFWGPGFVLIAWATFACTPGGPRAIVLATLTTVWGLRLGAYLAWRNLGKGEDPRYQAMRDYRGNSFRWVSLITVFGLQGVVMWLIALPVQVGQTGEAPMSVPSCLGIAIWGIGFLFETIGDYQLARFKSVRNPDQKVMDQGLWRYTRHPNYFGNALIWWGLFLVAVSASTLWLVVSPIFMTFLLLKVSGVALLERNLASRSAEYRDYVLRTSAFIPWPSKCDQAANVE